MNKDEYKAILEQAKSMKPDLTADEARQILANYESKVSQPQGSNLAQSIYNLAVKPTVEGVKGYGELVGSAGLTLGSMATQNIAPELSEKMANKALDIRQQTGMEGSFDQGLMSGAQTVGVGALKGAGGALAAIDLYSLGTAGSLTGVTRQVAKKGVRNLLVNSGLYGTGETFKAAREGEDLLEAFMRGAKGDSTTGIFEGITGDEQLARAADVAVSIGLPILLGKQINKVTDTIVDIGSKPAQLVAKLVDKGIDSLKIGGSIKARVGDALYEQYVNNVEAEMKTTQSMREAAKRKGIRLGEEAIVRGVTGDWDKDTKMIQKQNKEAVKLLKEKIASSDTKGSLVTKTDMRSILDKLKEGKDKRAQRILEKWFEDLPKHNLKTMDDVYEIKQLAGGEAFRRYGNVRDNLRAQAYNELFWDMRDLITNKVEGADTLMRHIDAGILLEKALQRSSIALRPKDIERQVRQLLSHGGIQQYVLGKGVEKAVQLPADRIGQTRIQQSPSQIRMNALQNSLGGSQ